MTETMAGPRSTPPMAVVGLACRFPDADDPAALLDVVLTGRRTFRHIPRARIDLADYYRSDPSTSDATYSTRAALIEGWRFDARAFGVDAAVYHASDPVHWLALETAARALAAAGLPAGGGLNRDRTGVIIGNTLGGDASRANALRVRWPYVRRALTDALSAEHIPASQAALVLRRAERGYLAPFPAIGPYTLAGSRPATIAAAISAYFGFRGGSHAVDSAGSSSLQAVASACTALAAGDLDAALAGGVDLSLDPLELIGLAKAGVLATTDVRLYDQQPSGYLPGEGCGVVVLMRAADARAAGLPVYAEILGWGAAGGSMPGQVRSVASSLALAMRRAYNRSGVDPGDIAYIEGNGAATPVDDEAELAALASVRAGARRPAALGSVKANIGHAKAAAGSAGLIKTVLALSAGVVPPTTGVDRPHAMVADGHATVVLPDAAREWNGGPRLAAISTIGFGGAAVHVVLRHSEASRARHERRSKSPSQDGDSARLLQLAGAPEPTPFLLHAGDRKGLAAILARLADRAGWLSDAEMVDLACTLGRDPGKQGPARVALIATRQDELAARAQEAIALLPDLADGLLAIRPGIFASEYADGRVTLLLSGEHRGGAAAEISEAVHTCLDTLRWLASMDVIATAAVGHGIGLLAGLAWAGVLREREVMEIAELRARFLREAAARSARPNMTGARPGEPGGNSPGDSQDATALHAAVAERFRFGPPRRRLVATGTGAEIGSVAEAIDIICSRLGAADRVAEAVTAGALGATLLLETGPEETLAAAAATTRVPALSVQPGTADRANASLVAAGLFAAGALGDPRPLFAGRQARAIDIWREQLFITSPCELAPRSRRSSSSTPEPAGTDTADGVSTAPISTARHQDDLAGAPPVAAVEAGIAGPAGAETELATSREVLADPPPAALPMSIAPAADDAANPPDPAGVRTRPATAAVAGLAPWARCFAEDLRPAERAANPAPGRDWRVYAAARSAHLADLGAAFTADPGAHRTLAIVEDPADDRSRMAALAAARDAVRTGELVVLTTSAAFTGFFASLHAEHPSMGVTVLRVPPEPVSPAAISSFAAAAPGDFRELVLAPTGAASETVLTEVPLSGGGEPSVGPEDVVIISRACRGAGLALARVLACSGARIAVLGRAPEHDDTELIAGLEELRSAGARVGYEVIDITDPASLTSAVRRISSRLGPVTAIAHAASPGGPVPILDLTDADIVSEPGAQISALELLARSVQAGQLKLILSFGTVAGRYGLAGAGLHALSRGALASRAAEIAAARAGCRALHIDMAPWSPAGLGERPGFAAELAAADTPAIDLATGSRLLLKIMSTPGLPASTAVHGRIGGLAHRRPPVVSGAELAAAGLPGGGRFVREIAVHYPGIELICSARLSLASDPYLADYRMDGMAVLPPMMALEALAQAASALAGRPIRQASSVRFDSPVLIPVGGEAIVRVCAQRQGGTITASLRCADSSYRVDHARAEFSGEPTELPDTAVALAPSALPQLASGTAGLVDGAELYGPVCFQSGRFRRIALLPEVTARSGRAVVRGADDQPWFAAGDLAATSFLLGSPGLNDAALQVLQACVPHRRIRPAGCDTVQFSGRDATGPVEIRAVAEPARPVAGSQHDAAPAQPPRALAGAVGLEAGPVPVQSGEHDTASVHADVPAAERWPLSRAGRQARKARAARQGIADAAAEIARPAAGAPREQTWSVEAADGTGQVLFAWRGVRLRDAGPLPSNAAWPPTLLSVFLERSAADFGLADGIRVTVSCGQPEAAPVAIPRQSRSEGGFAAVRRPVSAARHAGTERRGMSVASAPGTGALAGFTLAARASVPVACAWVAADEAGGQHRPTASLATAYGQLRAEFAEPPDVVAARLEAIGACLVKADLAAAEQIVLARATSDGWAVLETGRAMIASVVVDLSGVAVPVAIALLTMRSAHARPEARLAGAPS